MARIVKVERRYGKPWEVRWSYKEGGKRRHAQLAFGTKGEAESYCTELEAQLQRGYVPNVAESRRLFRDYAEEWLAGLHNAKPRTVAGYRQLLDNHVLPVFGEMALCEIRRSHIEDYVRALIGKGLTPPTIKHAFTPLRRILKRAVANDALARNPADGVALPTDRSTGRRRLEPQFLSPDQVEQLAAVLDAHEPTYGLLIRFMAYTGLRAGEVSGLDVGDVQVAGIRVHRTREKIKGGWREGSPKSETSTRTVPMPPWLRHSLQAYLRDAHPAGDDPAAPLFPGRHRYPELLSLGELDWSQPWERGVFYRSVFKVALRDARLPSTVRLHDLRHSYASICAANGIPAYRVARYMGHASVTTTMAIYTHLFEADADADMQRLDAVAKRPGTRGLLYCVPS